MTGRTLALTARPYARRTLLALLAAGFILSFPGLALDASLFTLENLLIISPVILIGVGLTAGITASGSMGLIAAAFQGRDLRMIGLASLIGALTPVCGISVLPLVAGLLIARVPLAPIMAFWLSSPITSPSMLAITAGTLGWDFAVIKTLAALGIGLFGGLVTWGLTAAGALGSPTKDGGTLARIAGTACSGATASRVQWRFWHERERRAVFADTAYSTARLMLPWLTLAFVAEFFLKLYLPQELVIDWVGRDNAWAVPLSAIVGAPIYLDGYAALPLIRGLIEAGMRPDAAMAFLIAGGITSAWAAIPVFALVRLPVFALYIGLAVASSILAGWVSGLFLL